MHTSQTAAAWGKLPFHPSSPPTPLALLQTGAVLMQAVGMLISPTHLVSPPSFQHLAPCRPPSHYSCQVLHVGKQCAYFPDRRRLGEASVRIPVDAAAAAALAGACSGLRSLRLCLGTADVLPDGLERLSLFSQLERCVGGLGGFNPKL